MPDHPKVRQFERRAKKLLEDAKSRGEPVFGIKPWYSAAEIIESGAKVALLGANPGGGSESEKEDERLGVLRRPYEESQYNAWLDDQHWEAATGGMSSHQKSVREAFKILFRAHGEEVLRGAACFNVVPVRTSSVDDLSRITWKSGIDWVMAVLEHVAPEIIVCNGNGAGRSAWGALRIPQPEQRNMYGTFRLKHGKIANGMLAGVRVIGLPHLARMRSTAKLRSAAVGWEITGDLLSTTPGDAG